MYALFEIHNSLIHRSILMNSEVIGQVNLNARIACIQTYFNSIVAGSINGDITLRDVREGRSF